MKLKIGVAIAFGVAITSVAVLSLNVRLFQLFPAFFLLPGGMISAIFRPKEFTPPVSLLVLFNSLFFAALVLAALRFGNVPSLILRRIALWLAPIAVISICLICVPRFNPLMPEGMAELFRQETELRDGFHQGMPLEQARSVLIAKHVVTYEWVADKHAVVFSNGRGEDFTAEANERVISAMIPTNAFQFPCGFRFNFALVFGSDNQLKKQYLRRFPLCP
jgi:hypothetical protein